MIEIEKEQEQGGPKKGRRKEGNKEGRKEVKENCFHSLVGRMHDAIFAICNKNFRKPRKFLTRVPSAISQTGTP